MRILVYPHTMELGGSQLNAIELAAGVRDRGHDVVVYAEDGPLATRVAELGLEHLRQRPARFRPGLATARDLARIVTSRGIDVVHGWEWPPILEGYAAAKLGSATVVGSIMSMSVAPFIPVGVPLTVGTQHMVDSCGSPGRPPLTLLEPPVDTIANKPGSGGGQTATLPGVPPSAHRVVVVTRLVAELKLEGILTAVSAMAELGDRRDAQLVVVGDGPCRAEVAEAAARANERAGHEVVFLTGELRDPRPAYDSAHVCIGMGGSALRALAFGTPLVVQGAGGFFEALTPHNADQFLRGGWYGVAHRSDAEARAHLLAQLRHLFDSADARARLGGFGRRLVEERFSVQAASGTLERWYGEALASRSTPLAVTAEAVRSGVGLVGYKLDRRWQRYRGTAARDDFNARPV